MSVKFTDAEINAVVDSYLKTAIWADLKDDDGEPWYDYTIDDVAPETRETARADVSTFVSDALADGGDDVFADLSLRQIGYELWLTRCGHGAGYWALGLGERGEALTRAAKALGDAWVYVGDDYRVYLTQ